MHRAWDHNPGGLRKLRHRSPIPLTRRRGPPGAALLESAGTGTAAHCVRNRGFRARAPVAAGPHPVQIPRMALLYLLFSLLCNGLKPTLNPSGVACCRSLAHCICMRIPGRKLASLAIVLVAWSFQGFGQEISSIILPID